MGPLASAYGAIHQRVVGLLAELGPDDPTRTVPATPEWSVHDLVAHMSGVVDDALNGRMAGAPGDEWTAAQVERSRSLAVTDLVDRWNAQLPAFLAALDGTDRWPAAFDLLTHEHDLRHALGRPGERRGGEVALIARMLAGGVDAELAVDTESGRLCGPEGSAARVITTDFEVIRSRFGRRTRAEVASYDWAGQPSLVAGCIDRWFIFGPTTTELGE